MGYARHKFKTEHAGAKKGRGAFWGRKKDAKSYSNKARRRIDQRLAAGDYEDGDDLYSN